MTNLSAYELLELQISAYKAAWAASDTSLKALAATVEPAVATLIYGAIADGHRAYLKTLSDAGITADS